MKNAFTIQRPVHALPTFLILVLLALNTAHASSGAAAPKDWSPGDGTTPLHPYDMYFEEYTGLLKSLNKANNLHFTYFPYGFTARAADSAGPDKWTYGIRMTGISRNGKRFILPQPFAPKEMDSNRVVFRHGSFDMEYINDNRGMRQNFIIKSRPKGRLSLKVVLDIQGNLSPELLSPEELLLGTLTDDGALYPKVRYKDLQVTDAHNNPLAASMKLEGRQLIIEVDDKDAEYPIIVDPLSTAARR